MRFSFKITNADLVKEFYANARKWENRDSEDTLNFENIGVSNRVNGQEIILDENLLFELFGLSNRGCIVKKGKGVTDFFNEEGTKVTVEIESIKRTLLEKAGVVAVEATLLDQNDLGVFWKMVHLFLTRILQPKQHTQSPFTNQDLIHTYLLMHVRPVNFAYVVIDCILDKVKNFNLPTFSHLSRERMEHMPCASHLTHVFKNSKSISVDTRYNE